MGLQVSQDPRSGDVKICRLTLVPWGGRIYDVFHVSAKPRSRAGPACCQGCVICVSRAVAALLVVCGSCLLPRCALGGLAWTRFRSAFPREANIKELHAFVLVAVLGGAALLALAAKNGYVEK